MVAKKTEPAAKPRAPRKKKAVVPKAEVQEAPDPGGVDYTEWLGGTHTWPSWRSKMYISAIQVAEDFFVTDNEVVHTGSGGDYLVVGAHGDVWIEECSKFQARFVPVSPSKA